MEVTVGTSVGTGVVGVELEPVVELPPPQEARKREARSATSLGAWRIASEIFLILIDLNSKTSR